MFFVFLREILKSTDTNHSGGRGRSVATEVETCLGKTSLQSQSAQIYQHRLGGVQIGWVEPQQHNYSSSLIYISEFT